MKWSSVRAWWLVLLVALLLPACNETPENNAPTTPTTPVQKTETFGGTLAPASSAGNYHSFSAGIGDVLTKITAITPADTPIGIGMGTWNGLYCTPSLQNGAATTANSLLGTVSNPMEACLVVYDPGTFTESVSYTVTVTHW